MCNTGDLAWQVRTAARGPDVRYYDVDLWCGNGHGVGLAVTRKGDSIGIMLTGKFTVLVVNNL